MAANPSIGHASMAGATRSATMAAAAAAAVAAAVVWSYLRKLDIADGHDVAMDLHARPEELYACLW